MNFAKKALRRTQEFVVNHQVAVAVGITAVVTTVVVTKTRAYAWNAVEQFLDEKGLMEEYLEYIPTK